MAVVPSVAERLSEARLALHRLNTGESVVEVRDQSGETIRYAQSSVRALERYIASLEREAEGRRPPLTLRFSTSKGV